MSAGKRSLVNWMRRNCRPNALASTWVRVVLPSPGRSSMSRCPRAMRQARARRSSCSLPSTIALAAARMGARSLLLSQSIDTLGLMSCNPAIGGFGKGHLVKEIDALGGLMARAAERAGNQFRILNSAKGPAVRATRAQADRALYKETVRAALENQPNLRLFQQGVDALLVEGGRVTGVVTQMGLRYRARAVVLTVGTFLAGRIHIGLANYQGGRAGDPPANALAAR